MTTLEQPAVTGVLSRMKRPSDHLCQTGISMFRSIVAIVTIIAMAGCATSTKVRQIDRLESVGDNPRILIMEPDIKYYRCQRKL